MKTTYHSYKFHTNEPDDKAAYEALKAKLKGQGLKCFESHGGGSHYQPALDGKIMELETDHIFNNQWNTEPLEEGKNGLRVFDWAMDYQPNYKWIKQGHYLDQTPEMSEIRRNRVKCGYCGAQEPAAKGYTFCPYCLGSEYLEVKDLPLTRMQSVMNEKRAPLTAAEKAHLLPLYKEAQLNGNTERDKERIAVKRADLERDYKKAINTATIEYTGFKWLMDKGIKTDNVIYYSHTDRFCFGWRKPVADEIKSELLDVISEFPFSYDIKCSDGNTLSNA